MKNAQHLPQQPGAAGAQPEHQTNMCGDASTANTGMGTTHTMQATTITQAASTITLRRPAAPSRQERPGGPMTCPMHPQIIRDAPGHCPICGMALEPVLPSLDDEENPSCATSRAASGGRCAHGRGDGLAMAGHRCRSCAGAGSPGSNGAFGTVVLWRDGRFLHVARSRSSSQSEHVTLSACTGAALSTASPATGTPGWFPLRSRNMARLASTSKPRRDRLADVARPDASNSRRVRRLRLPSGAAWPAPKTHAASGRTERKEDIRSRTFTSADTLRVRPGEKVRSRQGAEGASSVDESMITASRLPVDKSLW